MDDIHKLKNNCICFRNSQVKEPYVNDSPITCLKKDYPSFSSRLKIKITIIK